MKLCIDSKLLLNGLKQLSGAVNPNPIIPVLSNVKVEVERDRVVLTGSSSSLTIVHVLENDNLEAFSFLAPYNDLVNVCAALPGNIDIDVSSTSIQITSGDDKLTLGVSDEVKFFPTIPDRGNGFSVKVDGTFFNAINQAATSTSTTPGDQFNNIYIDFTENDAIVFASNRIHIFTQTFGIKGKTRQISVLPELVRPCRSFQESEMFIDEKNVWFSYMNTTVIAKTSEAASVPIRQLLSRRTEPNYSISRWGLSNSIAKALSCSSDERYPFITMTVKGSDVKIDYNCEYVGKRASVMTTGNGDIDQHIVLNAKNLKDVLNKFTSETDTVDLSITAHDANMYITSKAESIISFISPIN
ncbi:hypothetical protein LL912_00690 [Niabella sp. CC-SYL272]|uniref:hypothetical protein n=1 Tax=Niabella agricola TaxID=2891571 RepID=UPI001F253E8C|nr:hypothetical protein [Niabella agricola]MCF3107283.1 hypothetical protein [Niabella agricola]